MEEKNNKIKNGKIIYWHWKNAALPQYIEIIFDSKEKNNLTFEFLAAETVITFENFEDQYWKKANNCHEFIE